jgi:DNA-binding winged helix-turn-helix (wHTH) protein
MSSDTEMTGTKSSDIVTKLHNMEKTLHQDLTTLEQKFTDKHQQIIDQFEKKGHYLTAQQEKTNQANRKNKRTASITSTKAESIAKRIEELEVLMAQNSSEDEKKYH